jgi:probable rRNA maturation factor
LTNQVHKIEIADEQTFPLDPDPLIAAVERILTDHRIDRSEVSIALVDDQAIRTLNKQYLGHDYETDVISFVLDYDEENGWLNGQLIVSSETADRVARELGASRQDELLLYVVHGSLHLVGYDDQEPADAVEMREAEKRYLQVFGVEHRWSTLETETEAEDPEVGSR